MGPVTFVSILGSLAIEELFVRVLPGYDLSQMMHTDQQLILHRPVQVGNRLDCEVCLESFRQMGGTDIIVTKNLITDQHEEPVATTRTTLIARTGGGRSGTAPGGRRGDDSQSTHTDGFDSIRPHMPRSRCRGKPPAATVLELERHPDNGEIAELACCGTSCRWYVPNCSR
ncbi:MaoC family dehydratase N-terminal domain-containing protein [Rhodococcus sp. IEGM 1307]|uniref:FAS1-like dehydratase domain-containing protein n=1 Tax=Rhodococcus sp. IEGM 1307 TaxID=3047091 RepID=UPI0024B71BEA|nr:MaoC family dehydratase N-terminal domain-containing protein [Rhodococcus sp. IEGM 1307]MDI9973748.1 MaoC family dehydratase N-terminal domain-containing protein [Rhodococcus sp. IEGM 1307]